LGRNHKESTFVARVKKTMYLSITH